MSEYTKITLKRSGRRPLTFRGCELWSWRTSPDRAHPNYSGTPGRWTVLTLYQLADAATYVLHTQSLTNWTGERDVLHAYRFSTLEDVASWLERELPAAAPSFAAQFGLVEELSPAEATLVHTEAVGLVTMQVFSDGTAHWWKVLGPDGQLLVTSQPAATPFAQADREAFVSAAAVQRRYHREEDE